MRSHVRATNHFASITVHFAVFLAALTGLNGCSSTTDTTQPALTTVVDAAASPDPAAESTLEEQVNTTVADPELGEQTLRGSLVATIIDTHPHDSDAFTQGLEILDGRFIESTGLYGESDRRIVDIETGAIALIEPIDPDLFGEGLTRVGDELIQLTWKAGIAIRSDASTLQEISRDSYEGEGWGLCFDGESLAMSDGSSRLTFRDPETFDVTRTIEVHLDGAPVELLNELECVNGQVLANIWLSDLIVVIDPTTGEVVASLDGSSLRPADLPVENSSFALNGIAHDPDTGHFFLTGKLWPVIYEVELS